MRRRGRRSRVGAIAAATVSSLAIADEGPGIPEQDRAHVFDMFFRVRGGDGQASGTGLGLAIAKGIVDAHGGTIRAEAARAERHAAPGSC